jgi:hypothetical protein
MNRLTLLLALLSFGIFSGSIAQSSKLPVDEETGKITYKDVVKVEGSKEDLFNRSISWINSFYKNPLDVTRERNFANGVVKGLHRIKIKNTGKDGTKTDAGTVQYEFTLQFKDGRYRYILTDFVLKRSSKIPVEKWLNKKDPQYNPNWQSYLKQIDDFAQKWIESLKKGMQPPVEKVEEDW